MFDNIGRKIKTFVRVSCIVEIIVSGVIGVALLANELIWQGLLVLLGGPALAWIGSFFVYGFGQLVENSDVMVRQNDAIIELLNDESEEDESDTEERINLLCPHSKGKVIVKKSIIDDGYCKECPHCNNIIEFS